MIAKIAVSAAVFAIDKPYDYRVPEGMKLRPGMRVSIPFGRANRTCEGAVLALAEGEEAGLKPVAAALDDAPVLDERGLHLAAFLFPAFSSAAGLPLCLYRFGVKRFRHILPPASESVCVFCFASAHHLL